MKQFFAWEFSAVTMLGLSLGDVNQFLQLALLIWGLYSAYKATRSIKKK